MYHQQYYLHPAILQVWKNHQGAYIEEVQETGRAVRLGGDGRADTPGHCAMFGSYLTYGFGRKEGCGYATCPGIYFFL